MRDHSNHIELSRDEAVSSMLEELSSMGFFLDIAWRLEHRAIQQSYGFTLAQDVHAKVDVPSTLTCSMDSVAVHWDDFADLPEGEVPDTSNWVRGKDWQFANTGVAMPEDFDTAIVIEHIDVSDDEQSIKIKCAPSKRNAGTRALGSSMQAGQKVVDAETVITPDVAALIASAGLTSVTVHPRPKIAFLPTGDELVPPNLPFSNSAPDRYAGRGHVYESNSAVVQGKVEAWMGEFVPFDIVPDERDAIREALLLAGKTADVIVLNAGSSKGSDDWSVEVLEEMGRIICHQTNHGPGHHSSYAILDIDGKTVPVVGISGPSGGASFTLDFYLRPIMFEMRGLDPAPQKLPCRLCGPFGENKFAKKRGKLAGEDRPFEATEPGSRFYSVKFMDITVNDEGQLCAVPVPGRPGSPATMHANGIYMLAAGPDDVMPEEGSIIDVELRFGRSL